LIKDFLKTFFKMKRTIQDLRNQFTHTHPDCKIMAYHFYYYVLFSCLLHPWVVVMKNLNETKSACCGSD